MNGLHLDIQWSMYRPEYFETILSRASELGIDTILLEFGNKIFIDWLKPDLHPEHWKIADLKWFLRLAKKKNLTVIPSVPFLGHMEWILQWPRWAYLRENHDPREICPSHPATPEFLSQLLDETIRLFPDAPMILLGGDEAHSLGSCLHCKARGLSKGDLYLQHYLPLIQQTERAGKRAMLYGDMLLAHPEIIDRIPRSVVVCDWDYYSTEKNDLCRIWGSPVQVKAGESWAKVPAPLRQFEKYFIDSQGQLINFPYAAFLKEMGFDVVLLPAAPSCDDNYCVSGTQWHVMNAMAAARRARELNLMGTLITTWQVRFNPLETNWPSIAVSAWTYQDPTLTYDQLSERFGRNFFGCAWPSVFDDLDKFSADLPGLRGGHHRPRQPNFIPPYLQYLYSNQETGFFAEIEEQLSSNERSFRQGLATLRRQEPKITCHQESFDHWLLAAETLLHKIQVEAVLIHLAQGKNVECSLRTRLEKVSNALADRHRNLFGETLMPVSTTMEVDLRFKESLMILRDQANPVRHNICC